MLEEKDRHRPNQFNIKMNIVKRYKLLHIIKNKENGANRREYIKKKTNEILIGIPY